MMSQISKIVGKCSHHGIEKNNSTKELALNSSAVSELPKNNIVDLAIPSILQESLKQTARKFGLDDEFIHKIPRESLVSKETLAAYLFPEILDNLPYKSWETLNYKELFKLKDSEGMDIVLTGIKRGKKEFLIYILQNSDKNLLMNFQDMSRRSMLHLAAIYGQDEIVTLLLSHHPDLVSLESKDSDGLTAFHWAMHEGHEKIIQKLLNYNLISQKWELQKHSVSTLALAVASKNPGTVSLLLQNNHFKEINLLQPISPFGSVLHLAILLNEPKMVSYLLQTACSKAQDLLEITDKANRTPLQLAAFLGDLFAIKELCKKGAPIHQGENTPFGTPLHWAVKGKQPEAISLLLSLNADPLKADQKGKTAILYLDNTDLETPLGKRCKNLLDNFMRSKRVEKIKEANFQERPPFNLIFEGNCTTFDGFIGLVQALEAKKMIKDIRRCSGKGLGSIVAALLAIGYTASQLEDLSFKGLEDLFVLNKKLTSPQIQEIENAYLKSLSPRSLSGHLSALCDLTELQNNLEEIISSKMGVEHLTFGELKDKVEAFPHLYKHLHLPIYSLLKKQNIFFNTEDSKYSDFILSDVLAASLSFPGLLPAASLRRKNGDKALYEDTTYGKTLSVRFDTLLIDQFDDLIYQEDPYFKGRMTNYRTCSLQLNEFFPLNNFLECRPTLLASLITRHFKSIENKEMAQKISVGRVKTMTLSEKDLEEDVIKKIKDQVEKLFCMQDLDLPAQKTPQATTLLAEKLFPWKFDIFRKNKTEDERLPTEKELKQIRTLPHFNIFFTAREKELKEITDSFNHTKKVAICGLGGIGKSTLTLKYAHSLHGYEFIHFIKATALGSIQIGLIELAGLLSIKKDKMEETLAELRIYLQKKDLKGLLLIDGLDEESYFQELNGYIPPESTCHILISTRIGDKAKVKGFITIPVTLFTEEEASYYLTRGQEVILQEKTAAKNLAKEIGCLPLALSHIARYLDQEKITLCEYKERFQKRNPKLPGKDAIDLPDDEKSVFITWQVSLDAIAKKELGDLAISLMHFTSTLGEEDIPLSLFIAWMKHFNVDYGKYEIEAALKLLKGYSFLKDKTYEEDDNIYYNIHSLVQKVIFYQLRQEGKDKEIIQKSTIVLNKEIHKLRRPYKEFNWGVKSRLKYLYQGHLSNIFLLMQTDQDTDLEDQIQFLSHLSWVANEFYFNNKKVLNYINQGLSHIKNLDKSKAKLMMAEFYMIKSKLDIFDIQSRIKMVEKTLKIRSKVYEKDSAHIIECHDHLGYLYKIKGEYAKSLGECQKVLKWQKTKINKTNVCIIESYKQIIEGLHGLGKQEEALEVAKEMFKARKEALGEGDKWTPESYYQVIEEIRGLRKQEKALEVAKEVLQTQKEALDEGHEQIAETYKQVIKSLQGLGKKEEAVDSAKEMLKTRKEALGEGNEWTSKSYYHVIKVLEELGKKEEALEVAKEMLKTRKEALGEGNEWTSKSYYHVIRVLEELGKKEEALEVAKKMLKTRKEALGEGNEWTSKSYYHVIKVLEELEKKEEALEVAKEMLKTRKEALGEGNEWTSKSYYHVIKVLEELEKKEEALEIAKEMLKTRKEVLGEENEWTSESYKQVIEILQWVGKKEEELEVAKEMLKTRKEALGQGKEWTAKSYDHVIKALRRLGKQEEALEVAKEMLKTQKEALGEENEWTSESYKQVIEILQLVGKKEEELEVAKEMLKTRKEALGEGSWYTSESYYHVIDALKCLGKQEEVLEVAKEMLKTRKRALGEGNEWTSKAYYQVIKALKELGKKEEVLEAAREMLKTRKEELGEGHKWTSLSYKQVVEALQRLGKHEEACEVEQEMLAAT